MEGAPDSTVGRARKLSKLSKDQLTMNLIQPRCPLVGVHPTDFHRKKTVYPYSYVYIECSQLYIYIYMHMYIYMCICICIYTYTYVCIYVCYVML